MQKYISGLKAFHATLRRVKLRIYYHRRRCQLAIARRKSYLSVKCHLFRRLRQWAAVVGRAHDGGAEDTSSASSLIIFRRADARAEHPRARHCKRLTPMIVTYIKPSHRAAFCTTPGKLVSRTVMPGQKWYSPLKYDFSHRHKQMLRDSEMRNAEAARSPKCISISLAVIKPRYKMRSVSLTLSARHSLAKIIPVDSSLIKLGDISI